MPCETGEGGSCLYFPRPDCMERQGGGCHIIIYHWALTALNDMTSSSLIRYTDNMGKYNWFRWGHSVRMLLASSPRFILTESKQCRQSDQQSKCHSDDKTGSLFQSVDSTGTRTNREDFRGIRLARWLSQCKGITLGSRSCIRGCWHNSFLHSWSYLMNRSENYRSWTLFIRFWRSSRGVLFPDVQHRSWYQDHRDTVKCYYPLN